MRFRWELDRMKLDGKMVYGDGVSKSWDLSCLLMWSMMRRIGAKTTESAYALLDIIIAWHEKLR